ncbi:hypothetical protein KP001_18155 [Geomonas subterranea]|uniref:Uncharacterized protein n=1 Tax=Geomonas subterranea TaxID=2847989 RepID=A0ABX8LG39_9BACT|nr:hypothetical protein [Geomonas subterranea]QXE90311.1 hypothetical protein KP001_18155 [Geomonas subterranea]QXM07564.1 hypothetical protein KP002_11135 [Geomonas subterranea]
MEQAVALVQGAYFLITGLWPIFSITTFMMVTGPKTDLWLVKTVGAVLAVIGAALLVAGFNAELGEAVRLLAVGSAAALAAVDVIYVSRKIIAPIYLLDAVAEAALIAWWAVALHL